MLSKLVSFGVVTVLTTLTCNYLSSSADAAVFTLDHVTFQGGGEAIGSFNYDPGIGYSNISITTTDGTEFFTGTTYTGIDPVIPSSATELVLFNNAGSRPNLPQVYTLDLFFSSSLDKAVAGASVPILSSSVETFMGEVLLRKRLVNDGGSVSATAVPEPSFAPASFLAILGLGTAALRRKKLIST